MSRQAVLALSIEPSESSALKSQRNSPTQLYNWLSCALAKLTPLNLASSGNWALRVGAAGRHLLITTEQGWASIL